MSIVYTCPLCKEGNSVGPEFAGRRGTCAFCGATVIVPQTAGEAELVSQPADAAPRKSGVSWVVVVAICCAVMVLCGGVLAGLLLPAINAAREAGRRAACSNNIKEIEIGLLTYESAHGEFPPAATIDEAGRPLMSWRVAILPSLGQDPLYRQYDPKQPWNSPKNLNLVKQMPRLFRCPSDGSPGDGETSYVMITGKNMVGGAPGPRGTSLAQITDGPNRTILVVEVHGLKIPWTEPRDITLEELNARLRSGGRIAHVASFNVGMADGSVRNLPAKIDPETLRRLATINDGLPVQVEQF